MQEQDLAVIILAAGKGSRMQTNLAKVLIPIAEKPILEYVLDVAEELYPTRTIVVVGHQADQVQEKFPNRGLEFVLQEEQLGTGHAARKTEQALNDFKGNILVLCGDMPLIKVGRSWIHQHQMIHQYHFDFLLASFFLVLLDFDFDPH